MTDIQFKVGDAVQLRNGWPAEVLDVVEGQALCVFIRYKDNDDVWRAAAHLVDGRAYRRCESEIDLIHKPKRMSGFVNVYRNDRGELFLGAIYSCRNDSNTSSSRIACIDLSQFEEGEGL